MSLGSLKGPLACSQGLVLVRVVRTLHDIPTRRHVVVTQVRTVQLITAVSAVVLLVTAERSIDAAAVGTVV